MGSAASAISQENFPAAKAEYDRLAASGLSDAEIFESLQKFIENGFVTPEPAPAVEAAAPVEGEAPPAEEAAAEVAAAE